MTQKYSPYFFQHIEVLITEMESGKMSDLIEQKIFAPLKKEFTDVEFKFYPERNTGRGYYQHLSFQINAENKLGSFFYLVDGGFTDWTQQYLNNRKERLLISGIGTERIGLHFLSN